MRILVTGSNGFIGDYACNRLKHEHEVIGVGTRYSSAVSGIKYCQANIKDQTFVDEVKKKVKEGVVPEKKGFFQKLGFGKKEEKPSIIEKKEEPITKTEVVEEKKEEEIKGGNRPAAVTLQVNAGFYVFLTRNLIFNFRTNNSMLNIRSESATGDVLRIFPGNYGQFNDCLVMSLYYQFKDAW